MKSEKQAANWGTIPSSQYPQAQADLSQFLRAHLKDRVKVSNRAMDAWATEESGNAPESVRKYWEAFGNHAAFASMLNTLDYLEGEK